MFPTQDDAAQPHAYQAGYIFSMSGLTDVSINWLNQDDIS
jgi:hypothetical protein